MRKLGAALALTAAAFALVASTAEAAKTSEKEGRKFSRKWVNSQGGNYKSINDLRSCWRIGPDGAGAYRIYPRGVVCQLSGILRRGRTSGYSGLRVPMNRRGQAGLCYVVTVAVKDKGRAIEYQESQPPDGHADVGWCQREPGAPKPPPPVGSVGDPL